MPAGLEGSPGFKNSFCEISDLSPTGSCLTSGKESPFEDCTTQDSDNHQKVDSETPVFSEDTARASGRSKRCACQSRSSFRGQE